MSKKDDGEIDHEDGEIVIPDGEIKEPVTVSCPDCGTTGNVPNWFLGNEMECKSCEFRFTVTPTGAVNEQSGDATE